MESLGDTSTYGGDEPAGRGGAEAVGSVKGDTEVVGSMAAAVCTGAGVVTGARRRGACAAAMTLRGDGGEFSELNSAGLGRRRFI